MSRFVKWGAIGIVLLCVIGGGWWYISWYQKNSTVDEPLLPPESLPYATSSVIGYSVESRPIEAYTFGNGDTSILMVGGIHGGYEWNTVLLAYEAIDYFTNHPEIIPINIKLAIIPVLNPDGLAAVVGTSTRFVSTSIPLETSAGRFNANQVDLNRNFDCKWQPESTWRGAIVSAGSTAFSEPEAKALRTYVEIIKPEAVVFWHSQGNAVYGSECEAGILPDTLALLYVYAEAALYPAIPAFNAYPITGDAEGWLASIGIPALTVELSTHQSVEWEQNLSGIKAMMQSLSAPAL